MKQSYLFLMAVGVGLVLLGAGCSQLAPASPQPSSNNTETTQPTASGEMPAKNGSRCADSDNGKSPLVKGKTTLTDANNNTVSSKTDYCADDSATFEYYCNRAGDAIESTKIKCEENASCIDGACVAQSARLAQVNGACGLANGQLATNPPSVDLCSAGTPGPVTGNGPWAWTCAGLNGGTTANCSAPKYLMSGLCGSAHNATVASAPTANLCSRGTPSQVVGQVTGEGPWTWTCAGEPGAEVASCRALPRPLEVVDITNGYCGASHNATLFAAPTTNLCLMGTASAVAGEGPWTWTCAGSGGGTNANCTAKVYIVP